jgi:hypothetical protein
MAHGGGPMGSWARCKGIRRDLYLMPLEALTPTTYLHKVG